MNKPHLMIALIFLFGSILTSDAETNFYEQVSSLWFSGAKTNVLAIAEARLQRSTNDIAGLILKMEYEIEFMQFTSFSNTANKVLCASSDVSTSNFVKAVVLMQEDIESLLNMIPEYPPEEIEADIQKASIAGKPLSCGYLIDALQKDGYFSE